MALLTFPFLDMKVAEMRAEQTARHQQALSRGARSVAMRSMVANLEDQYGLHDTSLLLREAREGNTPRYNINHTNVNSINNNPTWREGPFAAAPQRDGGSSSPIRASAAYTSTNTNWLLDGNNIINNNHRITSSGLRSDSPTFITPSSIINAENNNNNNNYLSHPSWRDATYPSSGGVGVAARVALHQPPRMYEDDSYYAGPLPPRQLPVFAPRVETSGLHLLDQHRSAVSSGAFADPYYYPRQHISSSSQFANNSNNRFIGGANLGAGLYQSVPHHQQFSQPISARPLDYY